MSRPEVSICITCHDAEDTIVDAVESALAQSFTDREVVVLDDASRDRSRSLLEPFARNGSIRVLLPDRNLGIAEARNELVRAARGRFVAFFDDDDVSDIERVERQYAVLAREGRDAPTAFCYTGRLQRYDDGTEVVEGALSDGASASVGGDAVIRWALLGRYGSTLTGSAGTCTMMAESEVLRSLGGFDPAFRRCSDMDMLVRAADAGYRFAGVQAPLIIQRMTRGHDKALGVQKTSQRHLLEKHARLLERLKLERAAPAMLALRHRLMEGHRLRAAAAALRLAIASPGTFIRMLNVARRRRHAIKGQRNLLRAGDS